MQMEQFDFQSIYGLKQPQICGKSTLQLHVTRSDPAKLSHDLTEHE